MLASPNHNIHSEFLQSCDSDFAQEVMLVRNDTSYLSDIFAKFNVLNSAFKETK